MQYQPPPKSQLYGQVRVGRVVSVDAARHTAQVKFEEIDGFTSQDLQVLVTRPGDYSLPEANTPVVCLILDGDLGVGFVLGAIYTESDEAPIDDDGAREIAGADVRIADDGATVKVRGDAVNVGDDTVQLGGEGLIAAQHGVVVGSGIDSFTGATYFALQNASSKVLAKKS
jgi:phage baseplate assembly protein V